MDGAKHPANELTCLNNINKIYVETNREQCVSGGEHSSHTPNICNCVHYIHSKMLNGREKVHGSRFQVYWFQEVKQNINYLNDLNSSVRGSLVPFSLQHPLGPLAFLSSVKKNYQLWFSPSSLNLISSGPSVLLHNQLQAFLSHFLICCNIIFPLSVSLSSSSLDSLVFISIYQSKYTISPVCQLVFYLQWFLTNKIFVSLSHLKNCALNLGILLAPTFFPFF